MISFKVYLTRENVSGKFEPQIRRFEMEEDASTSFVKWEKRLTSLFPGVSWVRSRISWRDSEGDDILISSDSELTLALKEMSDQAISKFYVFESGYPNPMCSKVNFPVAIGPPPLGPPSYQ